MAISHFYWHPLAKNGNFTLLLTSSGPWMAISHCCWHVVVKNNNFTLLLASMWSRMAISHCYWTSSGLIWQMATFFTWWTPQYSGEIPWIPVQKNWPDEPTLADGPPTCWMAISHCHWHVVVKNGNFTLLLTSIGQEWEFHIAAGNLWSRMAISHCY